MAENKDKNVITEDKVTFRLCDDCLGVNLKTLIPKLKKKAPNAEFIIGCQSYCGPGRTQTFTLVNSRICIADTEVELMPLVDEKLRDRMSAEDEEKYRNVLNVAYNVLSILSFQKMLLLKSVKMLILVKKELSLEKQGNLIWKILL